MQKRAEIDHSEMVRLYTSGLTKTKIAERFGVHKETIHRRFIELGIPSKKRLNIPVDVATSIRLSKGGMTKEEIAKSLNVSPATVTRRWRKARYKVARRILLDINEAIRLYESGMSQEEVAKHFGFTQVVIYKRFKERGYKSRPQIRRAGRWCGVNNHMWKGDSAGYSALHLRLYTQRGRPNRCEVCGISERGKRYEWANISGKYEDPNDYKMMCKPCHVHYDIERRLKCGTSTMEGYFEPT